MFMRRWYRENYDKNKILRRRGTDLLATTSSAVATIAQYKLHCTRLDSRRGLLENFHPDFCVMGDTPEDVWSRNTTVRESIKQLSSQFSGKRVRRRSYPRHSELEILIMFLILWSGFNCQISPLGLPLQIYPLILAFVLTTACCLMYGGSRSGSPHARGESAGLFFSSSHQNCDTCSPPVSRLQSLTHVPQHQ